jgi:hypothetical protein
MHPVRACKVEFAAVVRNSLLGVADNSFVVDNRDLDYERNPIAVTQLLAQ